MMAKRGRRQPPLKPQRMLTPREEVARLLHLVRPSLENILHLVAQGHAPQAIETTYLYGLAQGIRISRQDMKSAKALERGIDELFGNSQQEVDVKGKSMEQAQKDVQKAVNKDQRPTIWTPEGEV